jgi:MFS family permease
VPRPPTSRSVSISPRLLVATCAFLAIIVVSNNSAGSVAQPAIGRAFDAGPADVGWVVFGFGTAFAVATAVWGGLARRFGLGPSLAMGTTLVAVGSALAVVAPSLAWLVAARIVQGLGAGAIPTLSTAAVARRFEVADRARALGTIVAAVGLGLAVGPLLGGAALELAGWQGPMAFGLLAAPAIVVLARTDRERDPAARIDLVGALTVAAAVVATTFALNRLPVIGLAPLTLGALGVLAVTVPLIVRRSHRDDAFVPRRVVADPAFTRVVALGAVGMSAFLGSLILVPVAAAEAHGLDGLALGLVILPLAIVSAVVSINNGRFQARLGRRTTTIVSLVALSAGALATGVLGAGAAPVVIALALVPIGFGFGLLQAPLINELTVAFGDADRPVAIGLYNLMFFIGGAAGAALATAIVQSGVELPFFAGRVVPGFSTTEVLLAVAPAAAVAILVTRRRTGQGAVLPD